MKDINQVTLRGRIGSVKTFGQNGSVASISVATTKNYQDKSGKWQEITTWHRVKAFASNKALPPFDLLDKGMYVCVTGELTTNSYTDKDGVDHETTEVSATDIAVISEFREANRQTERQSPRYSHDSDPF